MLHQPTNYEFFRSFEPAPWSLCHDGSYSVISTKKVVLVQNIQDFMIFHLPLETSIRPTVNNG